MIFIWPGDATGGWATLAKWGKSRARMGGRFARDGLTVPNLLLSITILRVVSYYSDSYHIFLLF